MHVARQGTVQTERRSGFTMVELLVALSVIALLAALLIPAVMSARESSRRTQCTSHLRQFGQALHGYEAARGRFPPATVESESRGTPGVSYSNQHYAPHVHLLAYLEQEPLFQQIDVSRPAIPTWDPAHVLECANVTIPVFLCPSDGSRRGTNYRVCTGIGPGAFDDPGGAHPAGGAFSDMRGHSAADFQDGLSNTVAASERIQSDEDPSDFDAERDYWFSNAFLVVGRAPTADEMQVIAASLTAPPPAFYPHVGQSWLNSGYDYTWYNHVTTPNAPLPDCSVNGLQSNPRDPPGSSLHSPSLSGLHKASSRHSGGVNVLLVDGAVRFINESVDLAVWRAMATRKGAEITQ